MQYNDNMKYWEALKRKKQQGFADGKQGIYQPCLLWGGLKMAYDRGHQEGIRMKVKTK